MANSKSEVKTILLAHGSSDIEWSNTFFRLCGPSLDAHQNASLAFMELSEPSLEEEIALAKQQGYQKVLVLPLFLAKGRHLKKDVPGMLERYSEAYTIETELLPPFGEHPKLAEALNNIITETLE